MSATRRAVLVTAGIVLALGLHTGPAAAGPAAERTAPSAAKYACSDSHHSDTGHGANNSGGYQSTCDPADFGGQRDNAWFPLRAPSSWVYDVTGGRATRLEVSFTGERLDVDGVSCAVCHKISTEKLGTRESYNGGFVVQTPPDPNARPEYGPFDPEPGHDYMRIARLLEDEVGATIARPEQAVCCRVSWRNRAGP